MEKENNYDWQWVLHPGINRTWLCVQLFGENTSATRSKLSKKLAARPGKGWLKEEVERLKQIRETLVNDIGPLPAVGVIEHPEKELIIKGLQAVIKVLSDRIGLSRNGQREVNSKPTARAQAWQAEIDTINQLIAKLTNGA